MRRLRVFVHRDRWERELDEEMRLHVELRARAYRDRGLGPDDAELAAKRRFGNRLALREATRDAWVSSSAESVWRDLTYSIRRLVRDRAASMAVIVTLALGIGANTAMITLIDRVLFKPVPVSNPGELVWLLFSEVRSGRLRPLSYPGYQRHAQLTDVFSGVVAFTRTPFSLGGDAPSRIQGLLVSGNYFEVLGVSAVSGRMLAPTDDRAGDAVAVISHTLWTNRFGADPAIAGKPIVLNGRIFTVAGVAPRGFGGLEIEPAAVWVPLAMTDIARPGSKGLLADVGAGWLHAVGRLRDGVTARDASAVLDIVASQQMAADGVDDSAVRGSADPIAGGLDPESRRDSAAVLGMLSIVPLLVLVVACANVGNLLLSRGLARRKELALRKALGAGRWRLVRQLMAESVLLALASCLVGVLFSHALTSGIVWLAEVPSDIANALEPDGRVFLVSILLAVVAALGFGLAPALASTNAALVPALKDGDISMSGGRRHRLRSAFLAAQVMVSFVLVVVAGLFLQSVSKALGVDPGFDPRNAVVMSFDPDLQGYDAAGRQRLHDEMVQIAEALPGVESAALSTAPPLAGLMYGTSVSADISRDDRSIRANVASISPGYFGVMRIPLLAGRDFTARDDRASAGVVIVNDALAVRVWPGASAVGQRLVSGLEDTGSREVVGVVQGGKYDEFSEDPRAFFFVPDAQIPLGRVTLIARTAVDAGTMIEPVRRSLQALDPHMPLFGAGTLAGTIRNAVDKQRAASSMLAVFGGLGLLLAAFGLYAVTSQGVTLRTREIGIRLALGAHPSRVLFLFMREGVMLCAIGIAAGAALSLALSGLLGSFLYGLQPSDALTYGVASILFLGVAAVASLIPARRAAVIDPLRALRQT
jgi:predicted permease